jgi:hypothetical protein
MEIFKLILYDKILACQKEHTNQVKEKGKENTVLEKENSKKKKT